MLREYKLTFKYCPAYAQFLLENKTKEFAAKQLKLLRKIRIPFLKYSDALPGEQVTELLVSYVKMMLLSFAENKVTEFIESSLTSWVSNQLPELRRNEMQPEDIAAIGFITRKTFRDFLPYYTNDTNLFIRIMQEIDEYCVELDSLFFKSYLALKKAEINALIENAPDAVIAIDHESRIIVWNPKCEEIFGWKAEEVTGRTLTDTIIPAIYRESHTQGMRRLLNTGEARVLNKTLELTALNKNTGEFHISLTISKGERDGQLIFIAFIRDISKEKQIQLELHNKSKELADLNRFLEQKNIELERTNKELESFNYIIGHDLQEPLRRIQVFSSRLADNYQKVNDEERGLMIERINFSAARLNLLIRDLLSFTLLNRKDESNFEVVNLNSVVQEILSDYQMSIDEKKVFFSIGKLPSVKAIRLQMQQLFQNLIDNAIKYAHPQRKPHIQISGTLIENGAMKTISQRALPVAYNKITVKDNGIGFEEEYSEKIFLLFQRLHTKDQYSGTGIGLAICKRVIEFHKGFIKVHSQPETGTIFDIYLPVLE